MNRIFRSTVIVGGLNVLNLSLNFVVNMIAAAAFGASALMDSYFIATVLPSYISTILIGALSHTFIPLFSKYRVSQESPWRVVSVFINLMTILLFIICFIGIIYAKRIIQLIAPGLGDNEIKISADLLRLFFPVIIFSVINELIASIFYAHEKFFVPLCNKLISPIVSIGYLLFFTRFLSIKALVFAQLTGSFIQCIILLIMLIRDSDFHFKVTFSLYVPEIKGIIKLMSPLIAFSVLTKIVPVFDRYFLSGFSHGVISYVSYAGKINLVFSTIITSIFSVQIFSLFSNYSAENKLTEMKIFFTQIVRLLFYISIPMTFAIVFFGEGLVKIIFERGAFTPDMTKLVSKCLKYYILSLPAISIGAILSQVYYALRDTITPMFVGIIEIILYVILCYTLLNNFGFFSIPIAYTVYFSFSVICLSLILRKKLYAKGTKIIKGLSSYLLLSVFSFLPLQIIKSMKIIGFLHYKDILGIAVGFLIYFCLSYLFKVPELMTLVKRIQDVKSTYIKN